LKKYYNKIDTYLLARHPNLWVLGIHIFIPIIVVTFLVLGLIGAVLVNVATVAYSLDDSFEQLGLAMVLPVILLLILFIIRQAKYNALRVHHFLPFKRRFAFFLAFWITFFGITSLPFATYFGSYFAPGINHNQKAYYEDRALLEKYMTHFYLKSCYHDESLDDNSNDDYLSRIDKPCDYRLDNRWDTLHLNVMRYNWEYAKYYNGNPDRISLPQARKEIATFISVAKQYKAEFKTEDVSEILEMNTTGKGIVWDKSSSNNVGFYTHIVNLPEYEKCIYWSKSYHSHRQVFRIFKWEFWRYLSLVGFSMAFLLIIYCSTNKGEFGWSLLVCALFPTVYGIVAGLLALFNILDGEVGAQILLALFGGAVVYVAFIGNFKPKLKRIFGISLNIMLPILVPIIISFEMLDEDEFFVFAFVIGLITTYIFSFYYRYQYLHPKKS
jgi:hypothetical protein